MENEKLQFCLDMFLAIDHFIGLYFELQYMYIKTDTERGILAEQGNVRKILKQ